MVEVTKEERREISKRVVTEFCNRGGRQSFLSMRVTGDCSWPSEFTEMHLQDRDWLLWPSTKWDQPGIIIRCQSQNGKEEAKLAMRFMSALAWAQKRKIEDEGFWLTGNRVNPCYRDNPLPDSSFPQRSYLDEYDYLPFPEDEKTQIALALYREAMCLNEDAYKFLSYFKILNIRLPNGTDQILWINSNIDKLTDHRAKEALGKLRTQHTNVGDYLYVSGRCAVAHAYSNPIINPDNPEDKRRLSSELPVIAALAELMIEQEFRIKSGHNNWKEHLYELQGFKAILGEDLSRLIAEGYDTTAEGESIAEIILNKLPLLCIRVRGESERPHENLKAQAVGFKDGMAILYCLSDDGLVEVRIGLDFKNERLEFDVVNGFTIQDDGSAKAAHLGALQNYFIGKLFLNGVFEIWSENGKLLGRKDPYLPVNILPDKTYQNYKKMAVQCEKICMLRTIGCFAKQGAEFHVDELLATTVLTKLVNN